MRRRLLLPRHHDQGGPFDKLRAGRGAGAFRAVDHAAVLAFAWAAQRAGAQRFFVVSALGADAGSRVFYNRVKGEMEDALRVLGFSTLAIFRPSLLLGRRAQARLGERVMAALLVRPAGSGPVGLSLRRDSGLGRVRRVKAGPAAASGCGLMSTNS